MAETVIGGALLVVLEDIIGLGDVLELLFGLLVIRVAVRMILHRQFTIGFLQVVGAGVPGNPKCRVKVIFSHREAPLGG